MALGLRTHDGIAVAFAMSADRRAWLIDGRLAALGGVIGTELSSNIALWLAVAEFATRYPIAMMKTAHEWLCRFGENHRTIRTTIVLSDGKSLRFAWKLGFLLVEKADDGGLGVMEYRCGA